MIYLVTTNQTLFESDFYTITDVESSLQMMADWDLIQLDSETNGRDPHLCDLLCVQFGNDKADVRMVLDCSSYSIELYKELLESKLLLLQNAKFDLQFLYKHHIIPRKIYDTMIVEQLLHLGYPAGQISYSLKAIADRRLGIDIDKTVRGEIIWRGLDTSVILYAAGDVTYLEKIMRSQMEDLKKQDLIKAAQLENRFVPAISYLEWCGIHLNQTKWKEKMKKDQANLQNAITALNSFIEEKAGTDGYTVEQDFVIRRARIVPGVSPLQIETFEFPENSIEIPNSRRKVHSVQEACNNEPEIVTDNIVTRIKRKFPFCEVNLQGDLFSGFNTKPKCIINWSSSKQVIQVVKWLGFDTTVQDKKTGENKDSVLEKSLSIQKGINDEFLKLYFNYQEYAKVVSSFGQGHLNAINPITDRIHTVFRQLGAASGRMSCGSNQGNVDLAKYKNIPSDQCTYPNIQQLPHDEETRACFDAPEGYNWVSCDWSAAEARLAGDIYNDQAIKDIFLNNIDSHSMYAKIFFKQELEGIDVHDIKKLRPDLRQKAKGPEFALSFGGGARAIMQAIQCSQEEADEIIKNYEEGFKGTADFAKKGEAFVKDHGYVLMCAETGHKMYWWDWDKWKEKQKQYTPEFWEEYKNFYKPNHTIEYFEVKEHFKVASKWSRMARNGPTQGSCAVALKLAITNFFNWIVDNGYFGKIEIAALVHDECNCIYPKELTDVPKILQKFMENAAAQICKSLPIPAEAEVSDHWIH